MWGSDTSRSDCSSHHPLLSTFTTSASPNDHVPEDVWEVTDKLRTVLRLRCIEGRMDTLTQFVECCCATDLPFKAADTLEYAANFLPASAVHPIHQLQFSRAVKKLETAVVGRSSCTNFPVIQGLCPYSSPAVVPRHPIRMAG
jgi:hypothetical protein